VRMIYTKIHKQTHPISTGHYNPNRANASWISLEKSKAKL
jgi:hypothetical protein